MPKLAQVMRSTFVMRFAKPFLQLLVVLGILSFSFGLMIRSARAATFTVTLASDTLPNGVPGELRWAVVQANATPGSTISFAIPGPGVHTISINATLNVTAPTTIDGMSQLGLPCTVGVLPAIEISPSGTFGAFGDGFFFIAGSDGSRVDGLVVNGFPFSGISLNNGGNNTITCSLLGVDPTGTLARPNAARGIEIQNSLNALNQNNVIGGTSPALRNIISGNTFEGIAIIGNAAGVNNNVIQGNYIGTDVTGTVALGNGSVGVNIFEPGPGSISTGNLIGGTVPGAGNVISANGDSGVRIQEAGSTNNTVQGNLIGTDKSGTLALANLNSGVGINVGASNNLVGGAVPGARNIISGNVNEGVAIADPGTSGNVVIGNYIGTDITGTLPLGNTQNGINVFVGPTNNRIGGTTPGEHNVIAANGVDGIEISQPGTNGNIVTGNYIGLNVTGTAALGNSRGGIVIFAGSANNVVGGTTPGERNIISANGQDGIDIEQPGSNGNVVTGNYIGTDATGSVALGNAREGVQIFFGAINNRIGGTTPGERNIISASGQDGIGIDQAGTNSNIVSGNYIGTDVTGTLPLGNAVNGIQIFTGAANNRVGGTTPGERNIISANKFNNIVIQQPGADNNIIEGNYIGTDVTGTLPVAVQTRSGVRIAGGAKNNIIGGTAPGAGNIISAAGIATPGQGVAIKDPGTTGNLIQGNLIGLNAAGTGPLGTGGPGVEIFLGATGNLIGGTTPAARNVISGNNQSGVYIHDAGTTGNTLQGNRIGTDAGGTNAIPNQQNGVLIDLTASGNTIGGVAAGAGNQIAFNALAGVAVNSLAANPVRGNSIYSNGGLGIDNAPTGVNPNTPNGPNNFPLITSADASTGSYVLSGKLNAAPSATYTLDFYASAAPDPSGNGEGQSHLGSASVTTDAAGNVTFGPLSFGIVAGQATLSITATDGAGNTSEFSGVATVVLPINPGPVVGPEPCGDLSLVSSQQSVLAGDQVTMRAVFMNNCGQSLTNLVIEFQVEPPLVILSPSPNCQRVTIHVGTLSAGQQYVAEVLAKANPVTNVAAPTVTPSGAAIQFMAFRRMPGWSPAFASGGLQRALTVVGASWDDLNLRTASQTVSVIPNGKLPGTGEHPDSPNGLGALVAAFGLVAVFGLLTVHRRRARTR